MSDRGAEKYERQKQRSREWKKRNPERHAELARAYRARNKEKSDAQNRLNYAIRQGRMERQPCEKCGTTNRVHAHHYDYSKPYDVEWLCYKCHKGVHPVTEEDKRVKFAGASPAVLNGEDNPNAKLSEKDVLQIRAMLGIGISQTKIAKTFDIAQSIISKIKRGVAWGHIR